MYYVGIGDEKYPMIISGPFSTPPKLVGPNDKLFIKVDGVYKYA